MRAHGRPAGLRKGRDIDRIEADGNYAVLHCGRDRHTLRLTMVALESQLPPDKFLLLSRSAIVNLECVRKLCGR